MVAPHASGSFDLVLSSLAIHNINGAHRRSSQRLVALDEAVRVLKPDGRLIVVDLAGVGVALAPSDPQQAAALLAEADTVAPGNEVDLTWALFTATRLADWPTALRTAHRLLVRGRRSGAAGGSILLALFSVAARGLAETEPETAAVLLGARGVTDATASVGAIELNSLVMRVIQIRQEATHLIVDALGEPRMSELSARGEAMDRDQASAYARTHIAEYLATLAPEAT